MARHKKEDLIKFTALNTAGAHAKIIYPDAKYISADGTGEIFVYSNDPDAMEIQIDRTMGVWQYRSNDTLEGEYPIGLYIGKVPWERTLTKIR